MPCNLLCFYLRNVWTTARELTANFARMDTNVAATATVLPLRVLPPQYHAGMFTFRFDQMTVEPPPFF